MDRFGIHQQAIQAPIANLSSPTLAVDRNWHYFFENSELMFVLKVELLVSLLEILPSQNRKVFDEMIKVPLKKFFNFIFYS